LCVILHKMPTLNLHISKNKVPRSKIQIDSIRTNREHYFNDLN
jgi:ribosomal protein L20A (L18A)